MHLSNLFHTKKKDNAVRLSQKERSRHESLILKSAEYKHFRLLRLLYLLMMCLFISSILGSAVYLYQKIYSKMDQVQNILLLDSRVQGDAIDFSLLEKVESAWNEKYTGTIPPITRDPFVAPLPPAPATVTSTPKVPKRP